MKLGSLGGVRLAILLMSSTAYSDDWARPLVAPKKIDFGVIATGSEAKKWVEVKNVYNQTIHISSVSTTCGCSVATPGSTTIAPGESTFVEVQMNTHKFRQRKDSNLIIRFDAPRYAELRIPITAYIRTDVVFDPGMIQFGDVDYGAGAASDVEIRYAGRSDWDIVDIKIGNRNLSADLIPSHRSGDRVSYRLSVKLDKDAAPGRIRDLITIVTNDINPYVPLIVEGTIVSDITVTPQLVNFRRIPSGQTASQRIVVRGKRPFRIEEIDCHGMADCFEATFTADSKSVHVVPIAFIAPRNPGRFEDELVIRIAGRTQPLKLRVSGIIN